MTRYLIVNADDFGLSAGVSRGIIAAHLHGIVTSTTFMTNFAWAGEMAAMLAEAPDLGVGIHLNLTTGAPVLPAAEVPTLIGSYGQMAKSLLHILTRVSFTDVRREWAAQVERGIGLLGRTPTHLDTHRFLQGHPGFAEVMIDLARTYKIPAVRCLYPTTDLAVSQLFRGWNPARLLVTRYLQRSAALVATSGLKAPRTTMTGDFELTELLRRLDRVQEGTTELICHPGVVDDQLRSLSSLQRQREVELSALTAPEAIAKAAQQEIRLISFRDLT